MVKSLIELSRPEDWSVAERRDTVVPGKFVIPIVKPLTTLRSEFPAWKLMSLRESAAVKQTNAVATPTWLASSRSVRQRVGDCTIRHFLPNCRIYVITARISSSPYLSPSAGNLSLPFFTDLDNRESLFC